MSKPLVLIAGSETKLTLDLNRKLMQAGYSTAVCRDGDEVLGLAWEFRPAIVVLESSMKDIHGFETCQRIKTLAASYRPRVLVLTDLEPESGSEIDSWRDCGVDAYFVKPVLAQVVVWFVQATIGWIRKNDSTQIRSISRETAVFPIAAFALAA